MLQESGIYQYETRMSVTPKGYGPDIDAKIPEEFRLEPIVFREIKGIFAFLVIGLGFASVVLIIEIIVFIIRTKNIWIVYSDGEREEYIITIRWYRNELVKACSRMTGLTLLLVKSCNIIPNFRRIILRFIRRNTISVQN